MSAGRSTVLTHAPGCPEANTCFGMCVGLRVIWVDMTGSFSGMPRASAYNFSMTPDLVTIVNAEVYPADRETSPERSM